MLLPSLAFSKVEKKTYLLGVTQQTAKSLRLPREIIQQLERFYLREFKKQDPDGAAEMKDSEILLRMKRKGLFTQVRFEPLDSSVLAGNVRYDMPLGGGEIDLSEQVRSQYPGRFKVYFDVQPATDNKVVIEQFNGNLKVLYISKGKRREVKGKTIGSGCDHILNITGAYKQKIRTNGVAVDVMNASHVSALAGYFIFAFVQEEHLHLGVIKFTDHNFSHLLCS